MNVLRYIVAPGFFSSGPVHIALAVGTVVAVTSAVVGLFTVTRGQSFAGHSLGQITALIAFRSGDRAKARDAFRSLSQDTTAPQAMRTRAGEMLAVLGS